MEETGDFLLHFRIRNKSASLESEVGCFVDHVVNNLRVVAESCSDFCVEIQHLFKIFTEINLFEERA